jgi:hypothetical protein
MIVKSRGIKLKRLALIPEVGLTNRAPGISMVIFALVETIARHFVLAAWILLSR